MINYRKILKHIKLFEQFIKINQSNELIDKIGEENLNDLINIVISDADMEKYISKNYKILSGGVGIAIIFDKFVIKLTSSEVDFKKQEIINKYKSNLILIYNFPYKNKYIDFNSNKILLIPMDKLKVLSDEEKENIFQNMSFEFLSFDDFKHYYNMIYSEREYGIKWRKKYNLPNDLDDKELYEIYIHKLKEYESKLSKYDKKLFKDLQLISKDFNMFKSELSKFNDINNKYDRLDINKNNLSIKNGKYILFDF